MRVRRVDAGAADIPWRQRGGPARRDHQSPRDAHTRTGKSSLRQGT